MAPPAFLSAVPSWTYHQSTLKSTSTSAAADEGIVLSIIKNDSAVPTLQLLICLALAYTIYKLVVYPRFLSPLRSLPQPKVHPHLPLHNLVFNPLTC